jgi:hypothetical protein
MPQNDEGEGTERKFYGHDTDNIALFLKKYYAFLTTKNAEQDADYVEPFRVVLITPLLQTLN